MIKVMIKNFGLHLFIAMFITLPLQAKTSQGFSGIGISVGNPTGITFKFKSAEQSHFNAALSWSLKIEGMLYIHVDYIFKQFAPFKITPDISLQPTMGIGARLQSQKGGSGARLPFGLGYTSPNYPIEAFIEITPMLDLLPATRLNIGTTLVIRYLF